MRLKLGGVYLGLGCGDDPDTLELGGARNVGKGQDLQILMSRREEAVEGDSNLWRTDQDGMPALGDLLLNQGRDRLEEVPGQIGIQDE